MLGEVHPTSFCFHPLDLANSILKIPPMTMEIVGYNPHVLSGQMNKGDYLPPCDLPTHETSCGNNIRHTQHSPTSCFLFHMMGDQ